VSYLVVSVRLPVVDDDHHGRGATVSRRPATDPMVDRSTVDPGQGRRSVVAERPTRVPLE
jgi:hypothetical protein